MPAPEYDTTPRPQVNEGEGKANLTDLIAAALRGHEYALGFDGIASDGEVAWLQCTCGWKLNFEMPEDDIRLAERVWDRHRAEAIAEGLPTKYDDPNVLLVTPENEKLSSLCERICAMLRNEGEPGHPGELIAVNEAQDIVREEFEDSGVALVPPSPVQSADEPGSGQ